MTVRAYFHTDASAPVLTGAAGALINVLDACLVNGYGAKAAAGWTKSFSGTNKAAYRQGGGNQMYLRVDATGTSSARVIGYEVMTDVDTGTGPFPADGQVSGGGYWYLSTTTTSVERPWMVLADDKLVFFVCVIDKTAAEGFAASIGNQPGYLFGDAVSFLPDDDFLTVISVGTGVGGSARSYLAQASNSAASVTTGLYAARSASQTGGSTALCLCTAGLIWAGAAGTIGTVIPAYPNAYTGKLDIAPVYVREQNSTIRGRIPGFFAPAHDLPSSPGDTFSLGAREFILLDIANAGTRGRGAFEISDTWDA